MNLLNINGWDVLGVKETAHDYQVEAVYRPQPDRCPHCDPGLFPKLYRHGSWTQKVMDLPSHGKRVGIIIKRVRWRCQACSKTFLQPLPDVDDRCNMTRRLVAYIEAQSLKRTFSSVAEDVGVVEGTVRNIFRRFMAYLDESVVFETPEYLGLDEVHILKKPRAIFVNHKERTIIALLEDRTKKTVDAFLKAMPDRERVQVVTIDMWKPYRDGVQNYLPNARVVVDKFHVIRMADDAVDQVRKSLREGLSVAQRRKMMRSRFLLRKRPEALDDDAKAVLDAWLQRFPALATAYATKEAFYGIYALKDRQEVDARLRAWEDAMSRETKQTFRPLLTALHNWRGEILAYFDTGLTNALTEALNGVAKGIQRQGRGYSFDAIRAKLLYDPRTEKRGRFKRVFGCPPQGVMYYDTHYSGLLGRPLLGADVDLLLREAQQAGADSHERRGRGR